MSKVFLFSSPIPKHEDVHAIFMLGPNFTPVIDPVESKIIVGVQGSNFLLDGKRSIKIHSAYNPKGVFSTNRCLNTVADCKHASFRLDGTSSVRTHGIKEALYCTGGIRVLLPLFRTLDQPLMAIISSVNGANSEEMLSDTVDTNFALQVFHLLQNMLQNNAQNQQHMVLAHGFQVIGYLLESINPQIWTIATLQALEQLALAVIGCEPLFRQLFLNVYLNFRIWIYTSNEVQKELLESLSRHSKKNTNYFRSLITVQRLIDVLRKYYWFTPEFYSEATKPIINPKTFETLGKRPDHHSIKQLRIIILQLSRTLADDGFTFEETRGFIHYLEDCADPEQGIDILQMLLSSLSNTARSKQKNDIQ